MKNKNEKYVVYIDGKYTNDVMEYSTLKEAIKRAREISSIGCFHLDNFSKNELENCSVNVKLISNGYMKFVANFKKKFINLRNN